MSSTVSPLLQVSVSSWPFSECSFGRTDGVAAEVQETMSEESSLPFPVLEAPEIHDDRTYRKSLSSGLSTDSEDPIIVINDTVSSGSEESAEVLSNDEVMLQRLRLITFSECDSVQSSGTEITSEGGESELEKRPLTPRSTVTLTKFLEDSLSDDGLSQDMFLLKHVRRHRHGFVSLKLLADYKQAKKLECDWRSLSTAARQSAILEVSSDGRKVRRKTPLPEALLRLPSSRVLAAVDVDDNLMTMENIVSTFGKYGNMSSLHLIRHKPGGGVPAELLSLVARMPEVSHTHCVLMQFDNVWGAARALQEFSSPKTSLHVIYKNHRKSSRSSNRASKPPSNSQCHNSSPRQTLTTKRKEHLESEWRRRITNEYRRDSTGSEAEDTELWRKISKIENRKPRGSLPSLEPMKNYSGLSPSLPNSPKPNRRLCTEAMIPQAKKNSSYTKIQNRKSRVSSLSLGSMKRYTFTGLPTSLPNSPKPTRRVTGGTLALRAPKGPDGTKGFHNLSL